MMSWPPALPIITHRKAVHRSKQRWLAGRLCFHAPRGPCAPVRDIDSSRKRKDDYHLDFRICNHDGIIVWGLRTMSARQQGSQTGMLSPTVPPSRVHLTRPNSPQRNS